MFMAGQQHLFTSRHRLRGYVDALKKHNLPVLESNIIHTQYASNKVEEYARYIINLPTRPDAIFALNDYTAIELMYLLKKSGLKIPDDIAMLGFNNEMMCRFIEPSLSSIDHPAHEIGAAAAEILINHIRHPELKPENRSIKSKLVVRESTMKIPQPVRVEGTAI